MRSGIRAGSRASSGPRDAPLSCETCASGRPDRVSHRRKRSVVLPCDSVSSNDQGIVRRGWGTYQPGGARFRRPAAGSEIAHWRSHGRRTMWNGRAADEKLLTKGEVALLCRVEIRTVDRWVTSGKLRHYRTPGGRLLFREIDVLVMANRSRQQVPEADL